MKKKCIIIVVVMAFSSCKWFGAGTLGAFQDWAFLLPKNQFEKQISLFIKSNPQYIIPKKWEYLDDWEERGFGFLNGKVFYFKNNPEELYYVYTSEIGFRITVF